MHVDFEMTGSFTVPDGTEAVEGTRNLFRLPGGRIVSVHPVIEMASNADSDDHRDLCGSEAAVLGIVLDLDDRDSQLVRESGSDRLTAEAGGRACPHTESD